MIGPNWQPTQNV